MTDSLGSSLPKRVLAAVLAVGLMLPASSARAGGDARGLDTILMKDGGRLRGTVIEEDPRSGVTVQLPDGTTRKVPKKAIDHVEYAQAAQAAQAPAPTSGDAEVTVAPLAAPMPAAQPQFYTPSYPQNYTQAPPPSTGPRSRGMLITGIILMPVGVITLLGGGAMYASSTQSTYSVCSTSYCSPHGDGSGQGAALGLITLGVLVLAAGIVFTIVGGHHRAPSNDAWMPAGTPSLAPFGSSSPVYLAAEGRGVTLHF